MEIRIHDLAQKAIQIQAFGVAGHPFREENVLVTLKRTLVNHCDLGPFTEKWTKCYVSRTEIKYVCLGTFAHKPLYS